MACRICGKVGGYECPTCGCDYCKEHYDQYVKQDDKSFIEGKTWYDKYSVEDWICQRCGAES